MTKKRPQYNLPKRKYCHGEKKMVSYRLPLPLIKRLDEISQELGWTASDIVQTAIDQFLSWAEEHS